MKTKMPIHRPVGTKVTITPESFQNIVNGNSSIHAYPCDSFVSATRQLIGAIGVVTHDFSPSYERTIDFDGKAFHMKDNWVETL